MFYFKLPYIGYFSPITQKKIHPFIKHYGKDLDIKLVFSSFKIGNLFGAKDLIPDQLHSHVVCKFVCTGCNACSASETCRHFSTRVRELLVSDKASDIPNICKILNIVVLCVQQISFQFFGSCLYWFSTQDKRSYMIFKENSPL